MATSNDILAKIEACDAFLAQCRTEAEMLSLAAVEGDRIASERLAEVKARADGGASDRNVLESAWRAARLREQAEERAKADARIAKHHEAAKAGAKRLLDLASEMDATIARFGELAVAMAQAEGHVRAQLNQAHALPADAVTGRSGIADRAFSHVANVNARGDFRTKRSLADIVLTAWSMLLIEEDADAA